MIKTTLLSLVLACIGTAQAGDFAPEAPNVRVQSHPNEWQAIQQKLKKNGRELGNNDFSVFGLRGVEQYANGDVVNYLFQGGELSEYWIKSANNLWVVERWSFSTSGDGALLSCKHDTVIESRANDNPGQVIFDGKPENCGPEAVARHEKLIEFWSGYQPK